MITDEMTPRTVVSAFDMNQTIKQVLDENTILRFSRIPVYEENIDHARPCHPVGNFDGGQP